MATMGHIRDLPKSKLGVEIKGKKITPTYVVSDDRGEQVKALQKASKTATEVILATDPDREGEAISWHVLKLLEEKDKKVGDKVLRVVFHSITKEAILAAMEKPRPLDMAMVDAQQARRILDRLVGYKLSPLLWKKVRRGLSAGRVQSVAVRLIVDREREIGAFKNIEYWEIKSLVETRLIASVQNNFWIDLVKIDGKKAEIHDGETAGRVVEELKKSVMTVAGVERKERSVHPHPPFKTSTLQQAAANVLGWSSKKTMSVAQKLYEQGNITYHRTDSLNLVESAVGEIREYVNGEWGGEYLPKSARFYKTSGKVVAQEAHEAIRPTSPKLMHCGGQANVDEAKLYGLIWKRTVASQMADAIYDSTKISVESRFNLPAGWQGIEDLGFRIYGLQAIGEIMKFEGWRRLYRESRIKNLESSGEEQILPEVKEGEVLGVEKVESSQKFTQPPARYNDASLVKELEKRGIGRPSTYAPTISTIIDRRYVDRVDRKFSPTVVGMTVTDFLVANFPVEMDFQFTADMENKLDDIAKGKEKWMEMILDFFKPFEEKVLAIDKSTKRVGVEAESTGRECPLCKIGEVVIREGKFGKFYSCNKFPECKYTAKIVEVVEGVVCELCGGAVELKKTKTGRDFYGCSQYPKCTWASWKKPKTDLEIDLKVV